QLQRRERHEATADAAAAVFVPVHLPRREHPAALGGNHRARRAARLSPVSPLRLAPLESFERALGHGPTATHLLGPEATLAVPAAHELRVPMEPLGYFVRR